MQPTATRLASNEDIATLLEFARGMFAAAFAADNTPQNMAIYLAQAFTLDSFQQQFADRASTFLVGERAGKLAGYAKLRRGQTNACVTDPNAVELERIYADSKLVGTGVGKALLQHSIDLARNEHVSTLWLGVWERNERAISFYLSQGFVDVGSKNFMLGKDRQRDRIMQLELS